VNVPVILWKPLIGVLGCASIAGCHGMEKGASLAPGHHRIVSKVSLDDSVPDTGTETAAFAKPTNSQSVETTWALLEGDERPGTAELIPTQEVDQKPLLPDASTRLLSLDELQQMAVASNPTLQQAQSLLEQARGNWLQVGLYPNPSIRAERGTNNAPLDMVNVYVQQDIVTGRKLQLNREVAAHDVQRARWEAEAQSLRVLNDVQIRFIAALGAQRQLAVAEELVTISQEGVRISEKLATGEQVSEADVLQARLQQSQTQIILRSAQFRAAATWKRLGNIIGQPDLPPSPLEGDLEEVIPDLNWDHAWQQLLNDSPSLRAAQARVAAAHTQVFREQKQKTPNLQLLSGVGKTFASDGSPDAFMRYSLNVGFTLPSFNQNQGNVLAAFGELRAAQSEVDRIELDLRNGLTKAFQRYQSARNQTQIYRDEILPMAEQNLTLTLDRYEEGEFDFLRVLTARRELFAARIDYVKSLAELRIAAIEIQGLMLTGGLEAVDSNPTPSNRAGQTAGPGS